MALPVFNVNFPNRTVREYAEERHLVMMERWMKKNPGATFEQHQAYLVESWKRMTRGVDFEDDEKVTPKEPTWEEVQRKYDQREEQKRMDDYREKMLAMQEEQLMISKEINQREKEREEEAHYRRLGYR